MNILKLSVCGVALATVFFFAGATVALAEFQSTGKGSSGTTAVFAAVVKGGGTIINCGEPQVKSNPEWEIEKEGKASVKGPSFHLMLKTWGTCSSEVGQVKRSASSSKCELELKQSKEEENVPMTVVSACTFTIESCEVKIEPKENSERKSASVAFSGGENENLSLGFEATGITTTVSSACGSLGIKSTHEAELIGAIEAQQVAPGGQPPTEFRMRFPAGTVPNEQYLRQLTGANSHVEVQLENVQAVGVAGPGATRFTSDEVLERGDSPAAFSVTNMTVAQCAIFAFGANGRCGMKVAYIRNTYPTNVFINFKVERPGGGIESRLFVMAQGPLV
jgi:hypothetical protein